jgi:hypothetical protein
LVRMPTLLQRISRKACPDRLGQRHTTSISFNTLPLEYLCLSLATPLALASSPGSIRVIVKRPTVPSTCQIQRTKKGPHNKAPFPLPPLLPPPLVPCGVVFIPTRDRCVFLRPTAAVRSFMSKKLRKEEKRGGLNTVSGMRASLPQG